MAHFPASPFRVELGATLRLAGPLALANLLQMSVYATDVIFIARLGTEPLAASSLTTALLGLMVWAFSGLTGAAAPLIAAELGRRRHAVRQVRRTVRMALWLAVLCGLLGLAVCQFGEAMLLALGQQAAIAARAGPFMAILGIAILPQVACNVLRIYVAALGRPVVATVIIALAIAINVLGNYLLVFGHFGAPRLGFEGSAWATVITSFATLAAYVLVIRFSRRLGRYRIFGRWWRAEWTRLREILRIGLPIGLIVLAEGGFFGAAAFLMGMIGAPQLAAHTIALQVAALFFQIPFGIAQAATIRVGFHFGAGDTAGVGRAGMAALFTCLLFQMAGAGVMLFAPRLVLSAYIDVAAAANAQVVTYAVTYLMVAAAFQLFDGIQAVAAGLLRGLQDTRQPMVFALFGYWIVGFTTAATLGFATRLQGLGVWIGLAVGLVVVAGLLLLRWQRRAALGLLAG